jgi:hypothetical protein
MYPAIIQPRDAIMPTKSQINAALKTIGYGFVRVSSKGESRVYRDHDNRMVKGIRGGSIGPMTCTNAHLDHNKEVIQKVFNVLTDIGVMFDHTDSSGMTMYYMRGKKRVTLRISAQLFPMYKDNIYSPEYKNYYILVDEYKETI